MGWEDGHRIREMPAQGRDDPPLSERQSPAGLLRRADGSVVRFGDKHVYWAEIGDPFLDFQRNSKGGGPVAQFSVLFGEFESSRRFRGRTFQSTSNDQKHSTRVTLTERNARLSPLQFSLALS